MLEKLYQRMADDWPRLSVPKVCMERIEWGMG